MGQVWLGQHNKDDALVANLHTGDEPMIEQTQAIATAAAEEAALISSLKEEARIAALVANPLVGDGV